MPCLNHPTVEERLSRCDRCGQAFCRDCAMRLRGASYCAPCKEEWVRDFQSGVVTGGLELAGVGYRFLALLIDTVVMQAASCLVVLPVAMVMGVMAGAASKANENVLGIVVQLLTLPFSIAIPVLYQGFMLKARGQTLGKMALSIKVVTPEGHPLAPRAAWLRAVSQTVLATCCLGAVDLLVGVFTWERTCLHDLFAKTRVVRVGNE
jgi:uncharacterized RDD family membrane protein YckC